MWLSRLLSRQCCGGPVLAMNLLCLAFGVFFVSLSAGLLGLVFIAVGVLAEALCFAIGFRRCHRQYTTRQLPG